MGGGNGAKSQTKRLRNATKSKKSTKTSQKSANAQAMNIICAVCRAPFMCTMTESALRQHADSKHPSQPLSTCFPHLQ